MPFAPSPTDGSIPTDLVLLAAERAVTVTREEHHQDVLSGRTGRAVVELRPCPIASGKHAGQDGLEVVLDGRRVGELTRLMAQRYRPVVDHLTARGYRAGCEAMLHDDARGTQVELRLPAGPAIDGIPTTRRPAPAPTVAHRRPAPIAPTTVAPHVVRRQRPPVPTTAIPHATPQRPHPPTTVIPPAPDRRRSRRALWVTAAVIGTLIVASALGNASRDDPPAAVSTLPTEAAAAAPSIPSSDVPSPALPAAPVTSPAPAAESVDEPVVAPARKSTAQARPPAATSKLVIRAPATTSKPAPRTVQAAPKPAPKAKPEPEPSGCDPNYSSCVPIASDVDCAGGSGNGPAYVSGPVRVVGTDKYGLDNDKDGLGCE